MTLDSGGVHPRGDRRIVNNSGLAYVETQLKEFFKNGSENICGPLVIDGKNVRVDFDLTTTFTGVEEFVTGGKISVEEDGFVCESEKPLPSYGKGETVRLFAFSSDREKIVTALKLVYDGGEKVVPGKYNVVTGKTEFTFSHSFGTVKIVKETTVDCDEVSGNLTGFTSAESVLLVLGGDTSGTFAGLVKENGSFAFFVPKGTLGIAFIEGGKAALIDISDTATLHSLSAELTAHGAVLGSVTLNRKKIDSKADLTFATYQKILTGEKFAVESSLDSKEFGSAERREYAALLPASATSGNGEITALLSATVAYGKAGILITDGEKMLAVQLGAGGETDRLFVNYGTFGENGARFNLNKHVETYTGTGVTTDNLNGKEWALKLVKTANGVEIFLNDLSFGTITNETLDEEFFAEGREYCFGVVSSSLAGNIDSRITLG